jgi:hypothetical protein
VLDKKGSESGSLSLCGLAFAVQDSLGFVVDSRGREASDYLIARPISWENELGGIVR